MTPATRILVAILLILAAATLRFHKLGAWPFAGDELATIEEAASLFNAPPTPEHSVTYRLPRAIPLSYAIHFAGYLLLGDDEFASRVPAAILGSLSVGLAFWILSRCGNLLAALGTSLLILLAGTPVPQPGESLLAPLGGQPLRGWVEGGPSFSRSAAAYVRAVDTGCAK